MTDQEITAHQAVHGWVPQPVDVSDVRLPRKLRPLVEALAENAHNIWAAQRIGEGWRYGPVRDDQARTHPLLVPYSELPEQEKDCDRQLAIGTVKFIIELGFLAPDDD